MITIRYTPEFDKWFRKLKDARAIQKIADRLAGVERGLLGDVKPVGEGVSEARIHYGAGYRLYFIQEGNTVVIMLAGGDKSTQERDIQKAKKLAKYWR